LISSKVKLGYAPVAPSPVEILVTTEHLVDVLRESSAVLVAVDEQRLAAGNVVTSPLLASVTL
jgi:hypothetical protein